MNIGPAEIIVVLVIALLVFGPKRLPQMGRSLGRGVREFRNAAATARTELGLDDVLSEVNDVKNDVTSSLGIDELKAGLDDVKSSMGVEEITAGVGSVKAAIASPRQAAKSTAKSIVMGKPKAEGEADTDAAAPAASASTEAPAASAPTEAPAAPDAPEASPVTPSAAAPAPAAAAAPASDAADDDEPALAAAEATDPTDPAAWPACD